jgi:hypothetical protein
MYQREVISDLVKAQDEIENTIYKANKSYNVYKEQWKNNASYDFSQNENPYKTLNASDLKDNTNGLRNQKSFSTHYSPKKRAMKQYIRPETAS